jgi:DNA-binding PadR family transcriptional regulator
MDEKSRKQREIQLPSGKEILVLELLLQQPSRELYGLEMVRKSSNKLKRGTIYVTLDRMESKGFVESRPEYEKTSENSLPRRLYKATGLGRRAYEAWEAARQSFSLSAVGVKA